MVDVAYAREKGIPVSNIPSYGTDAVGQFAIARAMGMRILAYDRFENETGRSLADYVGLDRQENQ